MSWLEDYKKQGKTFPKINGIFVPPSEEEFVKSLYNYDKMAKESRFNYMSPIVPEGYAYVEGTWDTGFVIEKETDGSRFTWVPVLCLRNEGSFNNRFACEKYGRKNFYPETDTFSQKAFHEEIPDLHIRRIYKYGGFFLSTYNISVTGNKKKTLHSVEGVMPMTISPKEIPKAIKLAESFEKDSSSVVSSFPYGADYDSVVRVFMKLELRKRESFIDYLRSYGHISGSYWKDPNLFCRAPNEILPNGSCERWKTMNIYDFDGNVCEATQERYSSSKDYVIRGGCCCTESSWINTLTRSLSSTLSSYHVDEIGFRVVLTLR